MVTRVTLNNTRVYTKFHNTGIYTKFHTLINYCQNYMVVQQTRECGKQRLCLSLKSDGFCDLDFYQWWWPNMKAD